MKYSVAVIFSLFFTLFAKPSFAEHAHSGAHSDRPSVHGMLVVGKEQVYLSHLPMFMSPHDYQVIAETEFPAAAKAVYLRDRAQHPEETVYTLVPENFVLPEMVSRPRLFRAALYRGHFERGGTPIVRQMTLTFKSIVHFRKFDPRATHPSTLQYLAFGQPGGETFLAHLVTARPDFDHVLSVPNLGGVLPRVVEFPNVNPIKPLTQNASMQELYLEHGDLAD